MHIKSLSLSLWLLFLVLKMKMCTVIGTQVQSFSILSFDSKCMDVYSHMHSLRRTSKETCLFHLNQLNYATSADFVICLIVTTCAILR